jgi:hypothetical protein
MYHQEATKNKTLKFCSLTFFHVGRPAIAKSLTCQSLYLPGCPIFTPGAITMVIEPRRLLQHVFKREHARVDRIEWITLDTDMSRPEWTHAPGR